MIACFPLKCFFSTRKSLDSLERFSDTWEFIMISKWIYANSNNDRFCLTDLFTIDVYTVYNKTLIVMIDVFIQNTGLTIGFYFCDLFMKRNLNSARQHRQKFRWKVTWCWSQSTGPSSKMVINTIEKLYKKPTKTHLFDIENWPILS